MKWKPTDDLEDKTLDSILMTADNSDVSCFICRHLRKNGFSCKAFEVIPASILAGYRRHTEPMPMLGQKNKIVFKPKK